MSAYATGGSDIRHVRRDNGGGRKRGRGGTGRTAAFYSGEGDPCGRGGCGAYGAVRDCADNTV